MQNCPKHPDQETMVPCIGCGRYFCRLCEPPRGAGQYCASCFEASLESLRGKGEDKQASEGSFVRRWWKKINQPVVLGAKVKKETVGAKVDREKVEPARKGKKVERVSSHRRARLWIADKLDRASRSLSAAWQAVKRFCIDLAHLPGRGAAALWKSLQERFPLGVATREKLEVDPPFKEAWYKLVAFMLGGSLTWIIVVSLTYHRWAYFSWIVAAIVAGGVVWSMGVRFDWKVGLIASMLALFSLGLAEMVVILLFKAKVIPRLDVFANEMILFGKANNNYLILFNFIFHRMLPSAVIAFLIGWWPLPLRLRWRGFGPHEIVSRTQDIADGAEG